MHYDNLYYSCQLLLIIQAMDKKCKQKNTTSGQVTTVVRSRLLFCKRSLMVKGDEQSKPRTHENEYEQGWLWPN